MLAAAGGGGREGVCVCGEEGGGSGERVVVRFLQSNNAPFFSYVFIISTPFCFNNTVSLYCCTGVK